MCPTITVQTLARIPASQRPELMSAAIWNWLQSRQEPQEQGNRQRATQPNAKIKQEVRMEKQIYILQLNELGATSEIQIGL